VGSAAVNAVMAKHWGVGKVGHLQSPLQKMAGTGASKAMRSMF